MYIRSSKRDEDQSKLIEEGDQAPSSEKGGSTRVQVSGRRKEELQDCFLLLAA